jgi:hypothetical protein
MDQHLSSHMEFSFITLSIVCLYRAAAQGMVRCLRGLTRAIGTANGPPSTIFALGRNR